MVEISGRIYMQILVSVIGILIMIAAAWLLSWYKKVEGRSSGSKQTQPDADLAGGEV
jgi:protein-S-isoprenylcysteine O-methyltransferase Ste14